MRDDVLRRHRALPFLLNTIVLEKPVAAFRSRSVQKTPGANGCRLYSHASTRRHAPAREPSSCRKGPVQSRVRIPPPTCQNQGFPTRLCDPNQTIISVNARLPKGNCGREMWLAAAGCGREPGGSTRLVPRTQRSAILLYRGALLSRAQPPEARGRMGPGSAAQRCTLHRVRDTKGVRHALSFPRLVFVRVLQFRLLPLRLEGAGKAGRRRHPQHRVQWGSRRRTRI